MNQTFAINKHWRNIGIVFLLLLSILFVIGFTKANRSKHTRQNALLTAINEKDISHSFVNGCVQIAEYTFLYFEQGAIWAKEMDKTTDIVHTSFIEPKIVTSNGVHLIYEYPFSTFFIYNESNFIEKEANIPISYVSACPLGRYAVLNDLDSRVDVYEKDSSLIFSLNSTLPIADIALSLDGSHLFLSKISLTKSNFYWLESYSVDRGKQTISKTIVMESIPYCSNYKNGWFIWNDNDAYYITKHGKMKVLEKTT